MEDQYVSLSAAWFTLSLINAGLAQTKQRSGLSWWFLSLFLGPFATLLIVVWPPAEAEDEQPTGAMTGRQALIIGGGILVVLGALFAFLRFSANT
jgi:hypothetical protein